MKGRENLDDIQYFLESVITRCFTHKYALLPKRREAVQTNELDVWNMYKQQEEYFKGRINLLHAFLSTFRKYSISYV